MLSSTVLGVEPQPNRIFDASDSECDEEYPEEKDGKTSSFDGGEDDSQEQFANFVLRQAVAHRSDHLQQPLPDESENFSEGEESTKDEEIELLVLDLGPSAIDFENGDQIGEAPLPLVVTVEAVTGNNFAGLWRIIDDTPLIQPMPVAPVATSPQTALGFGWHSDF